MDPNQSPYTWQNMPPQPPVPPRPVRTFFFTGKKEIIFAFFTIILCWLMADFVIVGGLNMGFAIVMSAYILCAVIYSLCVGGRLTPYSLLLLLLCLGISAGYGRSDDDAMKFSMLICLIVGVNLALCLMAGQNRYAPGGVGSLLDVGNTVFVMSFGQIGRSFRGLFRSMRGKNSTGKNVGAVLIGILITLPVLGVVVHLLMDADAAFDGMMEMFPNIDIQEITLTLPVGVGLFCLLYSRNVALRHHPKTTREPSQGIKGLNAMTVNTVLIGVCLVYVLYLVSQLAYVVGGFAGMLPEEFTMAEYARRGFFEMVLLCIVNMAIIILAVALVRKVEGRAPLATRLLCLFVGLVTLFLVVTASAKMTMYIGSFGLTRMRLLSGLLIIFLGVTALMVSLSMLMRKPRYMKVLVVVALMMGVIVFWADVDTVIATYNVNAYQSGQLEEIDMDYLSTLNDGAIPQIAKLVNDQDWEVAMQAREILEDGYTDIEDFRDWNYAEWYASYYK